MTTSDIDHDFIWLSSDLGGITESEVMGRGRIHQLIDHDTVALMEQRVRKTGVLTLIEAWKSEDSSGSDLGGRPSLISERALLTGLLVLAKQGEAMHLTLLTALFQHGLGDESRELLGLERSSDTFIGHIGETKRWYHNVRRAFHRLNDLMDPFPQERRHSKTYTEIQAILAAHDEELEEKRKARLDEFTRCFIVMTFHAQPRHIRRISSRLDISFDQTFVNTPTKKGYSNKTLAARVAKEKQVGEQGLLTPGPVDAYAGWHVKAGARTDNAKGQADQTTPDSKNRTNYSWGWMGNLATRTDAEAPGQSRFPSLIVAATLSLPNVAVAEEALSLMRAAKTIGLAPGVADADKQYWANSLQERLHDPAFAIGFTPSTDYRVDRLGRQKGNDDTTGKHGAFFIEGGVYCPGTPAALQNATKDSVSGLIDADTYRARIKERKAFQLYQKERPNVVGRTMLRCPALGPSPTVTCPLRELAKTATPKARPGVHPDDVPDFPDSICSKHSAAFNVSDFRRQAQAFQFGSPEWEEFHSHARNTIESINQQLKSGGTEDIESSNRRRVRGMGAAQIILTMLITNFNIRKIAAFLSDKMKADAKAQTTGPDASAKKIRRRDREWHNPYTDTYPAGTQRPEKVKPPGDDEDSTGGPPLLQ